MPEVNFPFVCDCASAMLFNECICGFMNQFCIKFFSFLFQILSSFLRTTAMVIFQYNIFIFFFIFFFPFFLIFLLFERKFGVVAFKMLTFRIRALNAYLCRHIHNSNYQQIQSLAYDQHEMATETISLQQGLQDKGYEEWVGEMIGMREILRHFSNVSTNDVVGMRAPYLKPGRNAQYKVYLFFSFVLIEIKIVFILFI